MTKMSSLNYMELCRLCLVKEKVSVPIFEGEGGERQIFDKIATCLPVKVSQDDKLPKKICSDCVYRVENSYQFWNTTSNSEKQLLEWVVNDVKVDSKNLVSDNITMETEQLVLKEEAIDHDQTAADVAKSLSRVEAVLTEEAGQPGGVSEEEEEEEDSDDGGGGGGGEDSNSEESGEEPPGKEEIESEEEEEEEEPYEELEPTTFVNVSLACDEAGPSGIQQTRQQTKQDSQTSAASASATTANAEAPSTSAADPAASGVPSTLHKVYRGTYIGNPNHYVLVGSTLLPVGMSSQTQLKTTAATLTRTATLTRNTPDVSLKNYHCVSCNTSSLSLSELKKHNLNHHNSINICNSTQHPTNTTSSSSINKQAGPNSSGSYPCVQCDKSFKNQYLLQRHNAAIHSSNKCNVCGKHFNKLIDYKVHMKRFVDTNHFACDHCNATFKDKLQMTRHEQIHTDDKRYMCRFCDYSTYYVTRINTHERKHTGNYRHRCEVCNKGYNSLQNLESHTISVHSAEPHKCGFCGKSYTSKYRYNRHLLEHKPNYIPENKFQCDTCGKTFKRAPQLKKHMVCHLAVKPFECNQCGKRIASRSSLKNHIRTHTGERPAVCNVCGKAFPRPYIATHMRSHTGAKPFTCTTCDKSFTQRSTLVIHQRSHTGLRPYQCPTCSKAFVTKTLLNYHQKVHLK